jgi:4-hydroxybenzoate polyprenyltransferase
MYDSLRLQLMFFVFCLQMMLLLMWLAVLVAAGYLFFKQTYSRFEIAGLKYNKPLPLIGSGSEVLFRKEHVTSFMMKMYNKHKREK